MEWFCFGGKLPPLRSAISGTFVEAVSHMVNIWGVFPPRLFLLSVIGELLLEKYFPSQAGLYSLVTGNNARGEGPGALWSGEEKT